jgi:N-carbamoyl-L-amino-acid hydrolase
MSESFDRMWADLAPLGRDATTGGYRRYAWTATDAVLREWFRGEAEQRGLEVVPDRAGNLWAWTADPDATGPGLVVGSHLDSVPDGGAFDGPLGVVSAFAALDRLDRAAFRRPVGIACFADEEGARFGVACAGSRLLTGALDPDRARSLTDDDGTTMAEAMTAAGQDPAALGRDDEALRRVGTFLELHVEQGRALVHDGAAVGVASSIWPHGRWRLDLRGRADHAGTTRLEDRRDPMLPFATTVLAARDLAQRAGGVATFGRVEVAPNGTNAIPARVDAWLDGRAPDEAGVTELVAGITAAAERAARPHGTTVRVTQESWSPAVDFDERLRDRISAVLGGVPALPTGAGHDAGVLAARVPTAMLFVRNPTGVSHSPAEHAAAEDCTAGVRALAAVLGDLACR